MSLKPFLSFVTTVRHKIRISLLFMFSVTEKKTIVSRQRLSNMEFDRHFWELSKQISIIRKQLRSVVKAGGGGAGGRDGGGLRQNLMIIKVIIILDPILV